MQKRWNLLHKEIPRTYQEVKSVLLSNRGVEDELQFLNPKNPGSFSIEELGIDPDQLQTALERISQAEKNQETILIFGDYDADGICATAILWLTLHQLGFKVVPFIPHRERHGYGISHPAIDEILEGKKPSLIITVDNGIVAHESIKRLMEQEKIDVIVTDHHQPEVADGLPLLPEALAIVHTTKLCGAGVSWTLSRELDEKFAVSLLDLVGIATIADQVPLVGANRSFAKWGIEAIKTSDRVGLNKLLDAAKVDRAKISSNTIGFSLAPRINAMGRLKHGLDALRLLCTNNPKRAEKLVAELSSTNIDRQDLTADFMLSASDDAEAQKSERLIITASSEYHEGVIGLIAGRLSERYHKPAIAISLNSDVAKASARSVSGVNIIEFLRLIQDELLEVGGHPMAAGFSFKSDKFDKIKDLLHDLAEKEIDQELLVPAVEIDSQLPWELVDERLVELVDELSPFGQANPRPVFLLSGLKLLSVRTLGRKNEHLKLVVRSQKAFDADQSMKTLNILGWRKGNLASRITEGEVVSVVGSLELNIWNGRKSVQMVLRDLQ